MPSGEGAADMRVTCTKVVAVQIRRHGWARGVKEVKSTQCEWESRMILSIWPGHLSRWGGADGDGRDGEDDEVIIYFWFGEVLVILYIWIKWWLWYLKDILFNGRRAVNSNSLNGEPSKVNQMLGIKSEAKYFVMQSMLINSDQVLSIVTL